MKKFLTVQSYELGRRLVKGPRRTAANQAAPNEKSATGKTPSTNTKMWRKKKSKNKPKTTQVAALNIMQLNICGIGTKKTELAKLMNGQKVHIALLQETVHGDSTDTYITGYTSYACDCKDCRGIITYIRNDVTAVAEHLRKDDANDIQKVTAWHNNKKYTIYNVYSPPTSTCQIDDLQESVYHNTIVAGDFNGHSPLWGYPDNNSSGDYLEALNETTNLIIQQDQNSEPTLLHRAHGTLSRPDLTIISSDLDDHCKVQVLPCVGSDHKPILTTIVKERAEPQSHRLRWNFKKANWADYKTATEEEFRKKPKNDTKDINHLENEFVSIILKAAEKHIPRGSNKKYKPFWTAEIETAVTERHQARETLEASPSLENKIAYNKATATAKRTIATAKREKWRETCSELDLRKDGRKAWTLLGNLSGRRRKTNPWPMPEGETPKKRAEKFNKYFASINKSRNDKATDDALLKELKEKERSRPANIPIFNQPFTHQELQNAISKLKPRKSPGPDKVHNEMLQNLGPLGKEHLLNFINETWERGFLPKAWKNATITPILKKDKDPKETKSYRPISLTSCVGKVAERMINRRLYWWLEDSGILCAEQAGFRAASRTEDQLFRLCQNIQDGYQKGTHTTAVFIDLQQAYDKVWRKGLLLKMQRMGIQGKMYKWIKNFLNERTIQTNVDNQTSPKLVLEEGLPQGSALSCTLFLIFINDLARELKSEKALYADDLVIWHSHKYARQSARHLNRDLEKLTTFCKLWKLTINPSKTVYTVFTMSPKAAQQNLNINIDGQKATKDNHPTYLGVQLDTRLTLKNHIQNLKQKATKRLALIKRLGSTNWGSDMNTIRALYIGYVRSVLDYNQCLQITCSHTTQSGVDKIQNNALRFICGGLRSTPTSTCEIHTNTEPLGLRREKAALETFERCKRMPAEHPARKLVDNWKPLHRIKNKSIMHHIQDLKEKCHLPEERVTIKRISPIPPYTQPNPPEIKVELKNKDINKSSDPIELKRAAEETIMDYPEHWIHVYTDGSAFKATTNAGYGLWICFPDGGSYEACDACGSTCSNYEAELKGIQSALSHLHATFESDPTTATNIVIFTDSKSALQALEKGNADNEEVLLTAMNADKLLSAFAVRVVLQWIPGHTNIPGNERADKLAKKGTQQEQPDKPTTYQTTKGIITQNYKEEWMNAWARGSTGRKVYSHMNKTNPKDRIKSLKRKDQTSIFRLRTGHAPLNYHLNRINPERPPICLLCDHPYETVEHLLFQCPRLQDLRQQFLPRNPDMDNTLYSDREQLLKTSTFYNMALGRRARTQGPLD